MSRSLLRPVGLLVALALVIATIWWGVSARQSTDSGKKKGGTQTVTAVPAIQGDMPVYLTALGTVQPDKTVLVKSRVDGQLMKLHFKEGEMVHQGQLLAELDPRPFQVQVAQAEGTLARDQALLLNAEADLRRYQTLAAQDSISRQQLDTQQALVRQYQATVRSDQALVDNARLQLTYSRVSAPVSGRAGLRQVDEGNMVHASDAAGLVVITQVQPVSVLFAVSENNLSQVTTPLAAGRELQVEAWDRDGKTPLATGRLATVDNQVDVSTGTVKMKGRFENKDNSLFPNQFVNARLRVEVRKNAVLVPVPAVQHGKPGTYVYVVRPDSTVEMRTVTAGPSDSERIVIESGVKAGERIVLDGLDRLRDGARVKAVDPQKDTGGDKPGKNGGKKHRKDASAAAQG